MVKESLLATEGASEYDTMAKELVAHASVLGKLMVALIPEFKGMDFKEASTYIDGAPAVSSVPVTSGLRIAGQSTEKAELGAGTVYFDVLFSARTPENEKVLISVNVEIQKDFPTAYSIVNRGVFYAAREVSSQQNRVFAGSDYDSIRKTYSIWLCLHAPNSCKDTITKFSLERENLVGNAVFPSADMGSGLINVVIVCLADSLESNTAEINHFLYALLSNDLTYGEKVVALRKHGVVVEDEMKEIQERMVHMCNLGEGILEQGIAQGMAQGRAQLIRTVLEEHSPEETARILKASLEEVLAVANS